jgi:hypothetical protein
MGGGLASVAAGGLGFGVAAQGREGLGSEVGVWRWVARSCGYVGVSRRLRRLCRPAAIRGACPDICLGVALSARTVVWRAANRPSSAWRWKGRRSHGAHWSLGWTGATAPPYVFNLRRAADASCFYKRGSTPQVANSRGISPPGKHREKKIWVAQGDE